MDRIFKPNGEIKMKCNQCYDDGVYMHKGKFKKCSCEIGRSINQSYIEDLNADLFLNNLWRCKNVKFRNQNL